MYIYIYVHINTTQSSVRKLAFAQVVMLRASNFVIFCSCVARTRVHYLVIAERGPLVKSARLESRVQDREVRGLEP